jgi:hypothetical protein
VTIAGTWLLQEVPNEAKLEELTPTLFQILDTTDVTGLSLRLQWDQYERDGGFLDALPEQGLAIAQAADKDFALRVMGGRFTPIKYQGRTMVYDGSASNGLGRGEIIPLCFGTRGRRNIALFLGMLGLYEHVINWSKDRSLELVHLPWPGLLWAELALITQMTRQRGYNYEVVRDFHQDLMSQALNAADDKLSIEFATSGHVDIKQIRTDIQATLANHPNGDYGLLSTNNVSDTLIGLPLRNQDRRYGAQMVREFNEYDWPRVYTIIEGEDQHENAYSEYLEVYTPSFSGGTSAQLREQITLHAPVVEPDPDPDPEPAIYKLPPASVDVIQQLYSPTTQGLDSKVRAALANTDQYLTGFGTRIPAHYLDDDLHLLDESFEIAERNGLRYRPRLMMGGHVSEEVKAAMPDRFLYQGTGQQKGKIPRPTDGLRTNLNTWMLDYYREKMRVVFAWCSARGVDLFNVPMLGRDYSELYDGPEVQNDQAGWLAFHKAMIDIVCEEQVPGVTAGFGFSGHGPFYNALIDGVRVDMGMELSKHVALRMPKPDQAEVQGNGWSPTQIWGQSSSSTEAQLDRYLTTNPTLVPGAQAIQPWGVSPYAMLTTAQCQSLFDQLDRIGARQVELYLETPARDTTGRLAPLLAEYLA